MTEKEVMEFFEKVKGKKIRWSGWVSEKYFIPTKIEDQGPFIAMKGTTVTINNIHKYNWGWGVMEGFTKAENGECWEYFSEENPTPIHQNIEERHKCNCNSRDLFNFGCKCGGI